MVVVVVVVVGWNELELELVVVVVVVVTTVPPPYAALPGATLPWPEATAAPADVEREATRRAATRVEAGAVEIKLLLPVLILQVPGLSPKLLPFVGVLKENPVQPEV